MSIDVVIEWETFDDSVPAAPPVVPVPEVEPEAARAAVREATARRRQRARKLHAGMGLRRILTALSHIGWGPMRGHEFGCSRAILEALSLMMHAAKADYTASIDTTRLQIAKRASCDPRTVTRCMAWMEDAGVVEWHRGGIVNGAPRAGVVRVVKRVLVEWVLAYRTASDAEDARRNAETRLRIQRYRLFHNRPKRPEAAPSNDGSQTAKTRAGAHGDTVPTLPAINGRGGHAPAAPSNDPSVPRKETPAMKRKNEPPTYFRYLAPECAHGNPTSERCGQCQYEAIMRKQRADEANKAAAARRAYEEKQAQNLSGPAAWPQPIREYMLAHYPDAECFEWPRLILHDPEAKAIQLAGLQQGA